MWVWKCTIEKDVDFWMDDVSSLSDLSWSSSSLVAMEVGGDSSMVASSIYGTSDGQSSGANATSGERERRREYKRERKREQQRKSRSKYKDLPLACRTDEFQTFVPDVAWRYVKYFSFADDCDADDNGLWHLGKDHFKAYFEREKIIGDVAKAKWWERYSPHLRKEFRRKRSNVLQSLRFRFMSKLVLSWCYLVLILVESFALT